MAWGSGIEPLKFFTPLSRMTDSPVSTDSFGGTSKSHLGGKFTSVKAANNEDQLNLTCFHVYYQASLFLIHC